MKQLDITSEKSLETLSVLSLASIVFGFLFKLQMLFILAAILLFVGLFIKGLSRKVTGLWLKFSIIIGAINTRILLTIVFYVFLVPIALLSRMSRGDFLNITSNSKNTYWEIRDKEFDAYDMEKMW